MTDPVAPSPITATTSASTSTSTPTPTPAPAPTPLEALQQRHRKEQRDLVSRIMQKKKQASKKTRKGVNDECERLEHELRERQEGEVREVLGEQRGVEVVDEEAEEEADEETGGDVKDEVEDVNADMGRLDITTTTASTPPSPPPSTTPNPTAPPTAPARKKNRAKERLARRKAEQDAAIAQAEEEARNAPNPRELEKQRFEPLLTARKLALHEVRADGHCLYAAVADQLCTRDLSLSPRILGSNVALAGEEATSPPPPPYKMVRYVAAGWIESHREDFEAFMEDSLQEHVRKIRETGEWGGHLELLALARGYGVRICVLHSDGRVDRIGDEDTGGAGNKEKVDVWLGYYRHSHGLGEHYNSLRKVE